MSPGCQVGLGLRSPNTFSHMIPPTASNMQNVVASGELKEELDGL